MASADVFQLSKCTLGENPEQLDLRSWSFGVMDIIIIIFYIPLRRLKVAILKLLLPLPLLQTAIMEIPAILKAQTDAAATSSKACHFL